jgi:hypothetical protein
VKNLLVGPFSLGQTFDEDLRSRLAPLQDVVRAGIVSFVDQKIIDEAKKAVIKAAVIAGGVGLVAGILISPIIRGLLGLKK